MPKFKAIFFLFIPFLNYAQTDDIISSDELKEDFSIYRGSLEEAHPGLYWYRTKVEMDSIFDAALTQLDQPTSERAFYTLLSSITARIGCLHTGMRPSDTFDKANINKNARPFPFEVKLDRDRMFIYRNLSSDIVIVRGAEIIAINNREASSLIPFLVNKIPNDGYGDSWSRYALERSFRYYYHVFFGQPDYFQIRIRDKNGSERNVTVPGRLEKERYQVLKNRYPHSIDDEPVISLRFHNETNSAILKITRFDNWKIGKKKYRFKKVIKRKMKEILASDVANLIIDVGDRGGGNELWGLEILSYFLKEPFTAYRAVEFKTLDYNVSKKYSNTSWAEFNLIKLLLNFEQPGSTLNWKNYRGVKPYPPKKHTFNNDVYLLIGGSTASATSDFAAWVDELNLATIVGTETGGSYLGNTSNWEFTVVLPNTQLKLQLPLARYLTNVEHEELGRGVIPAYTVPTTIHDKLNDIDTQLNYTLQLIKKKQAFKAHNRP